MVRSMTGFGRSQVIEAGYQVSCEMKGVNHRYFDAYIRISRRYSILEEKIKEELKNHVSRGRIEVSINVERTSESRRSIKVDKELAIAYHNYLKEIAEKLNISPEISVIDIFRLPEVFSLEDEEEDLEALWEVLKKGLNECVVSLVEMRSREGNNLAQDILARNRFIGSVVDKLEMRAPLVAQENQNRLRTRLVELMGQEAPDEQRILQEAAIFADKASITEEIVRLHSHIEHLEELMQQDGPVGRKCDFLVQEMFREINTVASKANDLEMSRIAVDVKAELEKIREQMQNIE